MIEAIILSVCLNFTCQVKLDSDGATVWTTKPVEYSTVTVTPVNGGKAITMLVIPVRERS